LQHIEANVLYAWWVSTAATIVCILPSTLDCCNHPVLDCNRGKPAGWALFEPDLLNLIHRFMKSMASHSMASLHPQGTVRISLSAKLLVCFAVRPSAMIVGVSIETGVLACPGVEW
jgi:hypothetical protein